MRRTDPKTVEQWSADIARDRQGKRGKFRVLPREVLNSLAYIALSPNAKYLVLIAYNKLDFEPQPLGRNNQRRDIKERMKNNGEFNLTTNELRARGFRSDTTIARTRREAVEIGFFDVVKTGSFLNATLFKWSQRWCSYPDGDYKPHNQRPPGKNLYHQFPRSRRDSEATN